MITEKKVKIGQWTDLRMQWGPVYGRSIDDADYGVSPERLKVEPDLVAGVSDEVSDFSPDI